LEKWPNRDSIADFHQMRGLAGIIRAPLLQAADIVLCMQSRTAFAYERIVSTSIV
jgi:hypothetical protein